MGRKLIILSVLICVSAPVVSGQLTIEQCYEKAHANYPLVRQHGLIAESEGYNLKNASKGYLPQFSLSARATYQTDVTKVPVSVPGVNIPTINKDQYQIVAEVSQTIWDGGAIRSRRENIKAKSEANMAQHEVDMYALKGRINDLFFGILSINEQLALNTVFLGNLQTKHNEIASYVENGVANLSDLDAVGVEQVAAGQKRTELEALLKTYLRMLSAMIGEPVNTSAGLEKPLAPPVPDSGHKDGNLRPELKLFDALSGQLEAQRKNITAANLPKINLFIQGGYGNPGLNMLKNDFTPYAIGGVRLSWNFGGLYTRRNDMRDIDRGIRNIGVQRETFLFNNSLQVTRQHEQLEKYRKILADDDRIIAMRRNIRMASEAKVENGTMSVTDLMRDMNAEQNAHLNKSAHEIEMLQTIYELKNLINN